MKKTLLTLLVLGSLIGLSAVAEAHGVEHKPRKQINTCVATHSSWKAEKVDTEVYIKHLGEGTFPYKGALDEEDQPKDNKWCNNHQPGDKCPDREGKQNEVPEDTPEQPSQTSNTPTDTVTTPVEQVVATPQEIAAGQNFQGKSQ